MKIGIFDSGIGGLSVLHQARRRYPQAEYIYYADRAHVPYGERSREEITGFVDDIIAFLLEQGVQAVVIACNTATSAAVGAMREKYALPIIGMEPAVKKALDTYGGRKVLAAATPVTVRGEKMHGLLEKVDRSHLVDLVALPELVRFAEAGEFVSPRVLAYLSDALAPYALGEYASFVLGCTHFNYFKDSLRAILPESVHFVDGIEGTVNRLAACLHLPETSPGGPGAVLYYNSGRLLAGEELRPIQRYLERLDVMEKIR